MSIVKDRYWFIPLLYFSNLVFSQQDKKILLSDYSLKILIYAYIGLTDFNSLQPSVAFLYPLKTSENLKVNSGHITFKKSEVEF